MIISLRHQLLAAAAVIASNVFSGAAMADPASGVKVNAAYDISFNGLSVGDFSIRSSMSSREYAMNASVSISVLGGMVFSWTGSTKSNGQVVDEAIRPAAYIFASKAGDKRESIDLRFTDATVTKITLNPPRGSSSKRIPITQSHLQNVVDPLSAVAQLAQGQTQKQGSGACNKRLPIFDGKMRYDLVFSYKGAKQVDQGNYKGQVYVCRVKYVPIAGHKPNKKDNEEEMGAINDKIEVWMIPVKEAKLFVPYYILIPTPAGTASMTSTKLEIVLPSQVKRDLVN